MRATWLAVAVFALDRWTKWLVETRLGPYDSRTIIPGFFDIVHSRNSGVAFGILSNDPSALRTGALIAFSVLAMVFLALIFWRTRQQSATTRYAIALIFSGAIGNVFDRLRSGSVTDFLDFYIGSWHWYTFNIADTAITIGAALLLLEMLTRARAERKAHA
jgi:signal peptidase II